jgi:hypothetical protein
MAATVALYSRPVIVRGEERRGEDSTASGDALLLRDTLDEDDSDTLDGDEQGPLVTIIVSPSSS